MRSTFGSLEALRKALFAQQGAIQATGHNIANANTEGYSRQRVNLSATQPFPTPSWNAPFIPGQVGTGVEGDSSQRIRDTFIDAQVRHETNKNGYWNAKSQALSKMEDIMNEPTDEGLSQVLDQFWQALQDLSANPENAGAKSVVRQRGQAVADTFNYLFNSLSNIQGDLKQQIDVSVDEINAIAGQINNINKQIAEIEPSGYVANDLYDQRDLLVDKLSGLANIKVTAVSSGGNASDVAAGKYTIEFLDKGGNSLGTLVDGNNLTTNKLGVTFTETNGNTKASLALAGKDLSGKNVFGKLQGLIDSYTLDYPNMLAKLDDMAYTLAQAFNQIHNEESGKGVDFFSDVDNKAGAAGNITISDDVKSSVENIAIGKEGSPSGDHSIVQALANVVSNGTLNFQDGTKTTLKSYLQGAIGDMGVDAQAANRLAENTLTLKQTAENRRMSISGVSIDEEMTNLIKYQHAYSAAARMVTVVDQMLDTIVNKMGR
ncbi:flagellar hook-associated protein 1 FlgK [Scopulibacillus darangshiensis]|uniref:Flagellar hook-associated protein 1 n=1 Tax=Scopulibacillus darangshiensis TaxID=442528 RepID=A0A4R2NVA8_9BACL|nr:flagellar hook-associated protein FlgK [Scopulibacillus darangshiensis]TCP26029.1 flagellar hook-associated protein 1 FlgK [Scopulibacillus darangshiensis]